jgi:multisubunit Na+/H+ antiporter MnhC subunit
MMLMLILSLSVLVAASVWLILSRDTLRLVVGLAMLGGAANLTVFLAGRPGSTLPPIIAAGAETLSPAAANPLPQALVLTAIVIGFGMTAYLLMLALRMRGESGDDHVDGREKL